MPYPNSLIAGLHAGKFLPVAFALLCLTACVTQPTSSSTAPAGAVTVSQSKGLRMTEVEYAQFLQTKTPQELMELRADPAKRLDMAMNLHSTSELTAQAIAEGLDQDPVIAATLVEARRRVLTTALMEKVGRAVVAPDEATLDTLAHEQYERDKKKLVTLERRHIAHVLLTKLNGCPCVVKPLVERVNDVWKQLKAGGDIAVIAREKSQDAGSAQKGGDLGWVIRDGKLIRSFEDAAFALKAVGDVSGPVSTEYGTHIIKLLGIEPPRQLSYEETEAQLKARIVAELRFGTLQTRRGLAYPDPDTVDVDEIGKLVQQRLDEMTAAGQIVAPDIKGGTKLFEVPITPTDNANEEKVTPGRFNKKPPAEAATPAADADKAVAAPVN